MSRQAQALQSIARRLRSAVDRLSFGPPVTHVYNPLAYAWRPHARYLERFGGGRPDALLLGMNPGPFGMAQTGVPFGEVRAVRDWLGIDEPVDKPHPEHPRRPILGFACPRSEISGQRLWGWAKDRFGEPERFFARFFVHNYCPLAFMAESGRNITPDQLPLAEREPLLRACDEALAELVDVLRPRVLIGIGGFAQRRAQRALQDREMAVGRILHPSPASPAANRGWASAVERELLALGVGLDSG
jgi:single-strand selective monofunctional uracil DNA glycosylase